MCWEFRVQSRRRNLVSSKAKNDFNCVSSSDLVPTLASECNAKQLQELGPTTKGYSPGSVRRGSRLVQQSRRQGRNAMCLPDRKKTRAYRGNCKRVRTEKGLNAQHRSCTAGRN